MIGSFHRLSPGYQDIRISGYQDIRIRISEYQNIRISEYQNIRISEYQNRYQNIHSAHLVPPVHLVHPVPLYFGIQSWVELGHVTEVYLLSILTSPTSYFVEDVCDHDTSHDTSHHHIRRILGLQENVTSPLMIHLLLQSPPPPPIKKITMRHQQTWPAPRLRLLLLLLHTPSRGPSRSISLPSA